MLLPILMLCITVLAPEVAQGSTTGAWQGPVTVHTRFDLPEQPNQGGFNGVWLAGISTDVTGPPTALSIALSQKTGGWFPVWSLQLQSDRGLLPEGVQSEQGSGMLSGSRAYTLPNSAAPRWGHTYETLFSYDPNTGALSVWIHDATRDEAIFSGEFLGGKFEEPFYPAAGRDADGAFVSLDDITIHPEYVPRGVAWNVVEVVDGQPSSLQLTRIDRTRTQDVGVHVRSLESPGTFRLYLQREGEQHELARLDTATGEHFFTVPSSLLLPGVATMGLEYFDASERLWFAEERTISVGRLSARFDPLTFEQDTRQVVGGVTLSADGPLRIPIRIEARLWEQAWDEAGRTYDEQYWGDRKSVV